MKESEDILIKESIDLEKVFFELFRELGLKPAQCQIIRAFLVVSNGKNEFEASFTDLARVIYKTDGYDKTAYNAVRYAAKVLQKWQQENQLTLVEIVETGSKNDDAVDSEDKYKKSKYRFTLLADFAKAYSETPEHLEDVVRNTITELNKHFVPAKKKVKYHPNYLIKIAKNTIFTKLKRIFELAIEVGDEPYNCCHKILTDCGEILNNLDSEYTENQKRESFIREFESKLDKSVIHNEEDLIH